MIWTHGEEHLKTFIGYLNSIHPSIKFTHEYSNSLHQTLPFLDVQVHLINNHIQTDLHTKPKDKHHYLPKTSCHPNHTKTAIPFSLFLRIRRICSTETFFGQRSRELIEYVLYIFMISVIFSEMGKHSDFHLSFFQLIGT